MWMTGAALVYALAVAPACGESDRPPDPRCGDSLDGRGPPPEAGVSAGRAVLVVPHLLSEVVFWPILKTSAFVERHKLPQRLHAITTSDDGLVGVRPEFQYASGFLPALGLHLFYGRLPGPSGDRHGLQDRGAGRDHARRAPARPAGVGHRDRRLLEPPPGSSVRGDRAPEPE